MKRWYSTVAVIIACVVSWSGAWAEDATGIVYNDTNGNGVRDAGERGISGALVSNGVDIVATDKAGHYSISVTDDTIVFLIKPRGWMTPIGPDNTIPRFYYIHKPKGSPPMKYAGVPPTGPLPPSIDFPLHRRREPERFRVICFGDTQTRDVEEVEFLTHDILEDLVGTDAAFGITLGDNVFNDLTVFEPLLPALSYMGIPWRCVPGNHDHNHDAPTTEATDDTFERFLGPSYYAFDYGPVHFIVLNDIRHDAGQDEYHGGLGPRQMAFVKNDLSHVSQKKLVALLMHIPVTGLDDRNELYALLKEFPHTFSLSAHEHSQQHVFVDAAQGWTQQTPHHLLIHATACGSWWGGVFNERGIPIATMGDGGPNGYSIITFDRAKYSVEFRPADQAADYQMNIWLPDRITAADLKTAQSIVNVFAGSNRSRVEMQMDGAGTWKPMEMFRGKDPYFVQLRGRETALLAKLAEAKGIKPDDKAFVRQAREDLKPVLRFLTEPHDTEHLWRASLPAILAAGPHTLYVRTTDMFGHTYRAKRIFVVTEK